MKCILCKKDVFKGYYERVGGMDYYWHESCKNSSFKQFLDEEGL